MSRHEPIELIALQVLTLAGCSNDPWAMPPMPENVRSLPEAGYTTPSSPTEQAIIANIPVAAAQAKLSSLILVSHVRRSDHGLGDFFVCIKEATPPPDKPPRYYSVFFNNNDTFKGGQLSVIMDHCELQTYKPLPQPVRASPLANAKSIC